MRIQLSDKRIVPGVMTVWNEHGPEVDLVVKDIKDLGFAAGSVEEMYVFHVFEHLFMSEIPTAVSNWKECMAKGGDIYIIADDYEFIARAFIGGEMNVDLLNEKFSYPTRIVRENLTKFFTDAGYSDHDMRFWFVDVPNLFPKKEYEIVVSAKKI